MVVHASVLAGMPRAPADSGVRPLLQAASLTAVDVALSNPEPSPESVSSDVSPPRSTRGPRTPGRGSPRSAPVHAPAADVVRAAGTDGPSSAEVAAPPTPAHFVMTVGPVMPATVPAAPVEGVSERQGDTVYGEDGVDARPRLLAWHAPRYPDAAASAGVEVDVPVDVVIDTTGAVTEVRLPKHFGYGLDEAAAAAARSYRFSGPLKAGRPVRVRMRCTVMFRLN